jgi:hypothetical protein
MAQLQTFTDGYRTRIASLVAPDLTHLAVGDGAPAYGTLPDPAATALGHEIGRVLAQSQQFVTPVASGGTIVLDSVQYVPSATPTRFISFVFAFEPGEAQGNWNELGLFGAGVTFVGQGASLVAAGVAGDDQIGRDVLLTGTWLPAVAGEVDVQIVTGGASGVAALVWTDPGGIGVGGGGPVPVTFGLPIALGPSGAALTFTGGPDGVLTAGDHWRVVGTPGPDRPEFASGGVYDPVSNPAGQVLTPGLLVQLIYPDAAVVKPAVTIDVQTVVEVIRP